MPDSRVLLAYHSSEGQTEKIAERLRCGGIDVDLTVVEDAPAPGGFDGVVVGDSIHAGHHSRELDEYLTQHIDQLDQLPVALFQVSLTSASEDEEHTSEAHRLLHGLLDARSWTNLGPESLADFGPPESLADARPADFLADLGPSFDLRPVPDGPLVATTSPHPGAWETTDGLTWIAAPGQLPDAPPPEPGWPGGTTAVRLASGWLANDGSKGGPGDGDGWWMYLGDEWFSLDDIGIEGDPDIFGGGVGSTAIGNITIFYTANRNQFGEARNMWIVSNEPN